MQLPVIPKIHDFLSIRENVLIDLEFKSVPGKRDRYFQVELRQIAFVMIGKTGGITGGSASDLLLLLPGKES